MQHCGRTVALGEVSVYDIERFARQVHVRGKHENGDRRVHLFHAYRHHIAVHARHLVIEDDQINQLSAENGETLRPVLGCQDAIAL